MNQTYLDTARLLTQVAPLVFTDGTFALKGGTAINLFIRDMPRLSVDLDLVFPDHSLPRDEALTRINETIRQSAERLKTRGFQTHVLATADARDTLLADLEIPVVSLEDVYGGKLVAAMDRQHPRDLFDVMQLFTHEGITAGIRRAFVVYLASHNRPVHEVLFPAMRDVGQEYERNFKGMTADPVELAALLAARERMVQELQSGLDADERRFLLSLVVGRPEWPLLGIAHIEHLPGIRWKLHNLAQLERTSPLKFAEQGDALARQLG